MADPSVVIEADNPFGLSANFKPQSGTLTVTKEEKLAKDEFGNGSCTQTTGDMTEVSQSYKYCGSDFMTDIGTHLTEFGNADGTPAQVITSLAISMTAADYATIDVTGHNHTTNSHVAGLTLGYSDVSGALPDGIGESFEAWNGFGVPDFELTVGADAAPTGATITFTMDHKDTEDEEGNHFVGKNISPKAELSMDFSGIPTSNTLSAIETDLSAPVDAPTWNALTDDTNNSNEEFDTFALTASAPLFKLAIV